MAPVQRGREGLLAPDPSSPAREQAESVFEPLGDLLRREVGDARRRELDRQWNAVEPAADLDDRGAALRGQLEAGLHRLCAHHEEPHGFRRLGPGRIVGDGKRRHLDDLLPLDVERLPARREDRDVGSRGEDSIDQAGYRVQKVLAVVDDQQALAACERGDEQIVPGAVATRCGPEGQIAGRRHRLRDQIRVADRCEVDEVDAVRVGRELLGADPEGEARLAGTPDPRERHEGVLVEQLPNGGDLLLAADEARTLGRQVVGGVERAKPRELQG